jgi:NosR/NirI family nitrous oxide reductase transcriptional regulator
LNDLSTLLTDTPLWVQIWKMKAVHIAFFTLFLLLIILVMVFRDALSKRRTALEMIRYAILAVSFIYVGLVLKAQATTTNIIILVSGLRELKFPIGLYTLEPFLFLSFIFMALTIVLWGRGVFCGWLCPYGAMLELANKISKKLIPKVTQNLSFKVHDRLVYLKYALLTIILGASFYSFMLSEYMTEVEPFRTFVLKLDREWPFVAYFVILTVGSVVVYRGFCRYLCPLGAALALPMLIPGIPLIRMRRYDFCERCRICTDDCGYQAIGPDGAINRRECLNCLTCQENFWDEDVCPVMIRGKKAREREAAPSAPMTSFPAKDEAGKEIQA